MSEATQVTPTVAVAETNGVRKGATPAGAKVFKQESPPPSAVTAEAAPSSAEAIAPAEAAPAAEVDPKAARAEGRKLKLDELRQLAGRTKSNYDAQRALKDERAARETNEKTLRTQLEAAQSELAAAEKDPLAYLEKRGVKAKAIAERIAKGEDPKQEIEELRSRVIAAEKAREDERESLKQREAQQRAEAVQQHTIRTLLQMRETDAAKRPMLDKIESDNAFLHEVVGYHNFLQSDPSVPEDVRRAAREGLYSLAEILDSLETRLARRYGTSPAGAAAAPVVPSTSQTAGAASRPQGKPKAPTLGTSAASSTTTTVTPKPYKALSAKDQAAADLALYRASKSTPA